MIGFEYIEGEELYDCSSNKSLGIFIRSIASGEFNVPYAVIVCSDPNKPFSRETTLRCIADVYSKREIVKAML